MIREAKILEKGWLNRLVADKTCKIFSASMVNNTDTAEKGGHLGQT
jgi:hypothetical protein